MALTPEQRQRLAKFKQASAEDYRRRQAAKAATTAQRQARAGQPRNDPQPNEKTEAQRKREFWQARKAADRLKAEMDAETAAFMQRPGFSGWTYGK